MSPVGSIPPAESEGAFLQRAGTVSWMLLGIILLATVIYLALASVPGLVVPLIVATVVGILFVPAVDFLARYLPRAVASALVLLALTGLGIATVVVTIRGIVEQAPQIQAQITAGLDALGEWFAQAGLDFADGSELITNFEEMLATIIPGIASVVGNAFSSLASFTAGALVALFILYFALADWERLSRWVGNHLGVPADLGEGIVEDTVWSMRKYFYVLTLTSLVTATLIGLTVAVLGVPLVFTIAVVTFITSYVPYLGAIFSGAFTFLVALGAGGITDAVIVLIAILVVQNVVQPLMQAKLTEDALHLHPIVTFGSTIIGAAIAGILGATLSAPVIAMIIGINRRVRSYGDIERPGRTTASPLP